MKRKHDLDNFIKPINDQLFSYLNADDSFITELKAEKVHVEKGNEFIKIRLYISMCQ